MRRCSLCGGRLDLSKRCTLCGLDNTQNDEMYRHLVNWSDCVHKPLTHVHTEKTNQNTSHSDSKGKRIVGKKVQKGSAKVVSIIIAIVTIFGFLIEMAENTDFEENYSNIEEEAIEPDTYDYVAYDLPDSGMEYTITLEPGVYTVGTHLPEGTYRATVVEGAYGCVEINDFQNSIYLYKNIGFQDETTVVDDLRLYQEGCFVVSTGIRVELYSQNVQSLELTKMENSLTDKVIVNKTATAGNDFPAGVYDICYEPSEEWAYAVVTYYVPVNGYEYEYSIGFDGDAGADIYHNVVLPEGTRMELEDLDSIVLVPSSELPDIEIDEYYEYY